VLAVLGALLLAGVLARLSAFLLGRLARPPAVFPAFRRRLRGLDLLAAFAFWLVGLPALLLPGAWRETLVGRLLVGLVAGLLAVAWLRWRTGAWRPARPAGALPRGFGARCWLAGLPGYFALAILNQLLLGALGREAPVQEVAVELGAVRGPGLLPALLLAVLALPFLEELLFRGFLWRWLAGRPDVGPGRALFLSALLFALFHEPVAWLPILYLGGLFAWIYWRSGRLREVWMAHALHNAMGAAAALAMSHAPVTP